MANKANRSWVPENKELPAPDMMDRFDYIMECLNNGKFVKEFERLCQMNTKLLWYSYDKQQNNDFMGASYYQ